MLQSRFDGVSMRYSVEMAFGAVAPARRSSTRCSARAASGTTAGRPSPPTRRSAAGAISTTTPGSCTTSIPTVPSCTTWLPSTRRKLRELVKPMVRRGRRQRRVPARRPVRAGDHPDAETSAGLASRPLRLLAGHRRGTRATGGQRPQSLISHRRSGRHPNSRCAGRPVRPKVPGSAGTPSTSRATGCTTQQLRRADRAEDRRRPKTSRSART